METATLEAPASAAPAAPAAPAPAPAAPAAPAPAGTAADAPSFHSRALALAREGKSADQIHAAIGHIDDESGPGAQPAPAPAGPAADAPARDASGRFLPRNKPAAPAPGPVPAEDAATDAAPDAADAGDAGDAGAPEAIPADPLTAAERRVFQRFGLDPDQLSGIPATKLKAYAAHLQKAQATIDRQMSQARQGRDEGDAARAAALAPTEDGQADSASARAPALAAATTSSSDPFAPFTLPPALASRIEEIGGPELTQTLTDALSAQSRAIGDAMRQKLDALAQEANGFRADVARQLGRTYFDSAVAELGKTPGYEKLGDADRDALETEMLAYLPGLRERYPRAKPQELIAKATRAAASSMLSIDPVAAAQISLQRTASRIRATQPVLPAPAAAKPAPLPREQWLSRAATLAKAGKNAEEIAAELGPMDE